MIYLEQKLLDALQTLELGLGLYLFVLVVAVPAQAGVTRAII